MFTLILAALALGRASSQAPAEKCLPQPMPLAIDSIGGTTPAPDTIEFAATPSLEYPGRAWVVRLYPRRPSGGTIEIIRLRRQLKCNRYDIESRWQSPLPEDEYKDTATRIVPLGIPPTSVFVPASPPRFLPSALDGTSIDLRLRSSGWQVTRSLNYYAPGGSEISTVFRDLVTKYVPLSERPAEDWRTSVKR